MNDPILTTLAAHALQGILAAETENHGWAVNVYETPEGKETYEPTSSKGFGHKEQENKLIRTSYQNVAHQAMKYAKALHEELNK